MPRRLRSHLPGCCFHLTARLQGRALLLKPELRTRMVTLLRQSLRRTDTHLLAYALLSNHLHLVVRQGKAPLWRLMLPLLRRTALLVQRAWDAEDHVFGGRYHDVPLLRVDHLRNAIVYTHLNPVRAGLCSDPGDYAWSSHAAFLGRETAADGEPEPADAALALPLFAEQPEWSTAELRSAYRAYVAWRLDCDRLAAAPLDSDDSPLPLLGPETWPGDRYAEQVLGCGRLPCQMPGQNASVGVLPRPDLRDLAQAVLREAGAEAALEHVRSRYGGEAEVQLRTRIARRAAAAGYRGVQIAEFLRISKTSVSRYLSAASESAGGVG